MLFPVKIQPRRSWILSGEFCFRKHENQVKTHGLGRSAWFQLRNPGLYSLTMLSWCPAGKQDGSSNSFATALMHSEQRVLRSKLRDLSLSVGVNQRYRVVDSVRHGFGLKQATERVGCHFTVAYDWVHRFNHSGFASFEKVPTLGASADPVRRTTPGTCGCRLVQPCWVRLALFDLVGSQAGRVLSAAQAAAPGHG
jgi:Homeodomain-like domain-containing protein